MWKSLFTDMYQNLINSSDDLNERIVLGVHLFNIAKGLQCTGLQETDPETNEILPANWKSNPQLFSFRYTLGSLKIDEKLLKVAGKISIHAVRSDNNDKIFHYSIDLTSFTTNNDFLEALTERVLLPYEKVILSELIIKDPLPKKTSEKLENKPRSLLEDKPYGIPYRGGFFPSSNPYSSPFENPGNLVGPNHPMFGNPPQPQGLRWDPPAPFFMPPNPGFFPPPGPPGFNRFNPSNGFL